MISLSQASAASELSVDGSQPRNKFVWDPIHGQITLDATALQVVDTPQFQRLRDLKQLGSTYYVFPGGSHNRFEHSLGVYHLAGIMMDRFRAEQPELELRPHDVTLVKLAGLCHDLGHGPFSHIFDNEFIPRVRGRGVKWSHEDMSRRMLDHLVEENSVDLDSDDVKFVQELVHRTHKPTRPEYMYEIVANERNSIDVDKFDYIVRDTANLGLKSTFDFSRLMTLCRVVDDEICFHVKEAYNVYQMFHTRYSLFKMIYTHRAAKAIEFMITDAMVEADAVWNRRLSNAIDDPAEYQHLTDCVLREIESSKDPGMAKAQGIVRDIRTRNLYKFVDEHLLPQEEINRIPKVTAEEVTSCNPTSVDLRPEMVVVHDSKINYANKDKDPVNLTHFYKSSAPNRSFSMSRKRVSFLVPTQFQERIVRVFSRNSDKAVCRAISAAFRAYLRRVGRAVSPTPAPMSKAHEQEEEGGAAASAAGAASEHAQDGAGVAEMDFDEPQDRAVFDFAGSPVKGGGPRRMVAKRGSLVSPGKLSGMLEGSPMKRVRK